MKTLTLVVPCYNEEEALPPLFDRLRELKRALGDTGALDLLFVDDGSKDKTAELLKAIPEDLQPARVVTHNPNQGLGAAIATGFREARGQYVAMMDADCTYDPFYLAAMLPLMKPGVDILTGSEFHPQGKVENISWFRLFLSQNLSRIYRWTFWCRIYSFSCLMRIYRREILLDILPGDSGFLSCTEVLIRALQKGYKVVEFPLVLTERQHGETKMPIVKTIFDHLGFIGKELLRKVTGGSSPAASPSSTGQESA